MLQRAVLHSLRAKIIVPRGRWEKMKVIFLSCLKFSSDEHAGCPNQLKVLSLHLSTTEVGVHQTYSEVQGLVEQLEIFLYLYEPVYEDGAHLCVDVLLFLHVVWDSQLLLG